jgi:ubiquinone/menaquinone biosynthesis C-methylase UbiE
LASITATDSCHANADATAVTTGAESSTPQELWPPEASRHQGVVIEVAAVGDQPPPMVVDPMARGTELAPPAAARRCRGGGWSPPGWNGWGIPLYRQLLERLNVGAGTDLLDVGCGAGRFCRIAADRGARVSGIDATAPLVEITRERTRNGDFRVGDMEALPWPDNSFDVVTGFNAFFFGADLVRALREASRVARPGGEVAMTVFGRPERCESTPMFAALGQLLPSESDEEEGGPVLHEEGVLELLAKEAGLVPREAGYLKVVEEYPDLETLLRGYLAHGSIVRAIRGSDERRVRDALTDGVRALVAASGGVRIEDEYRYFIATA